MYGAKAALEWSAALECSAALEQMAAPGEATPRPHIFTRTRSRQVPGSLVPDSCRASCWLGTLPIAAASDSPTVSTEVGRRPANNTSGVEAGSSFGGWSDCIRCAANGSSKRRALDERATVDPDGSKPALDSESSALRQNTGESYQVHHSVSWDNLG